METTPVIVNSVLCFVHNFKETCPQISNVIASSFPQSEITEAKDILKAAIGLNKRPETEDIVRVYETAMRMGCRAQFAATDLSMMPLKISGETPSPKVEVDENTNHIDVVTVDVPVKQEIHTPEYPSATPSPDPVLSQSSNPSIKMNKRKGRSLDDTLRLLTQKRMAEQQQLEKQSPPSMPMEPEQFIQIPKQEPQQELQPQQKQPVVVPQMPVLPFMLPQAAGNVMNFPYLNMLRMINNQPASVFLQAVDQMKANVNLKEIPQQPMEQQESRVTSPADSDDKISVDKMDDSDGLSPSPSPSIGADESILQEANSPGANENGEKPFVCLHNNCRKRFANKFLLKKHQFIHTGLRPHICPYCTKKFNRKDNLLRHKKTHIQNGTAVLHGENFAKAEPLPSFFPNPFMSLDAFKLNQMSNFGVEMTPKRPVAQPLFDAATLAALMEAATRAQKDVSA